MDDLPTSLVDMLSQKKGANSEIDYCISKCDSDGKSHGDDYTMDVLDFPRKSKPNPYRLNSLEIITDSLNPQISLSTNNSPNRGQDAIVNKVITFPKSARLPMSTPMSIMPDVKINIPDHLSDIRSHSDLTQKSDYDVIKEEDIEESNRGSEINIGMPVKEQDQIKLSRSATSEDELCIYDIADRNEGMDLLKEVETHLTMADGHEPTYFDFEYRTDANKKEDMNHISHIKPVSYQDSNFASQNSSMMQGSNAKLSEKHISIPSFLIMTDATSVSKKIEQILSSKNYVHKQSPNQNDDVVAKIEVLIKRSWANPVLQDDHHETNHIKIDPREVHIPSPMPSPMVTSQSIGSRGGLSIELQEIGGLIGNFSKMKRGVPGMVDLNSNTENARKTPRSSGISNLIALCNEKLKDTKTRNCHSPSIKSKGQSVKRANQNLIDQAKNLRESIKGSPKLERKSSPPQREGKSPRKQILPSQSYLKVKRLSILQRNPADNDPKKTFKTRQPSAAVSKSPSPRSSSPVVGDFREYLKKKANQKRSQPASKTGCTSFSRTSFLKDSTHQSLLSTKEKLQAITQKYYSRGENSSLCSSVVDPEFLSRKDPATLSECRALSRDSLMPKQAETPNHLKEKKKGQLLR